MNTIILSDEDAARFMEFQQHYDLFNTMKRSGVFNIQYGKAVLNVAGGLVQNITVEEVRWKR